MQKRFPNGTFAVVDPVACSPKDTVKQRECSVQSDNIVGFYESSSWEYSWFVPHDTAHLIILMGGNVSQNMQPNPRDNERAQKIVSNRPPLSSDWTASSTPDTTCPGTSHPSRHVLLAHQDLCTKYWCYDRYRRQLGTTTQTRLRAPSTPCGKQSSQTLTSVRPVHVHNDNSRHNQFIFCSFSSRRVTRE